MVFFLECLTLSVALNHAVAEHPYRSLSCLSSVMVLPVEEGGLVTINDICQTLEDVSISLLTLRVPFIHEVLLLLLPWLIYFSSQVSPEGIAIHVVSL